MLLAVDSAGLPLQVGDAQLLTWREELVAQRVAWPELLEREGLRLALGEMRYLAHWVTPGRRPRRYDTRFFVAAAPVGQIVRVDGGEITEHVWMTASEALHRFETAEWTMLVPTVHTLRVLAPIHSVDEALHYAATSRARRTQPREIEREGRTVVVVPGEPGYED